MSTDIFATENARHKSALEAVRRINGLCESHKGANASHRPNTPQQSYSVRTVLCDRLRAFTRSLRLSYRLSLPSAVAHIAGQEIDAPAEGQIEAVLYPKR